MMIKNQILMSYSKRWFYLYPSSKLQKLAVEMFKVSRGLSPEIVNQLLQLR